MPPRWVKKYICSGMPVAVGCISRTITMSQVGLRTGSSLLQKLPQKPQQPQAISDLVVMMLGAGQQPASPGARTLPQVPKGRL